ncbi:uncharacterized protein EDB91DRAFT_1259431 [Suillus paluster]|uniref:uncharacterized protein n=1 Tax=Suillus paluster TaxID=48578 RepID=UPI001B87090A|nr:uncharacterized protein EDB91DRAFT_1259431 [Suillus paluster]KAG1717666.1 hypothetical protein EDB91DRAFT_1259431 [Suillus paluster]
MSGFVPNPLDDRPPPLGEEPNHPQDPGETNFVISEVLQVVVNSILAMLYCLITQLFRFVAPSVLDPLDDTIPPLSEELSHPEHPQDQR